MDNITNQAVKQVNEAVQAVRKTQSRLVTKGVDISEDSCVLVVDERERGHIAIKPGGINYYRRNKPYLLGS
ncbi:hypothetical protein LCGC14_2985160 [marine sediment metagenome]|uniref:Uncharacterized protein n=1 Tax=marine sediment metagenome TaxID=412755 RepID=A0A0F8ZCW5_9ZZZZ